MRKPRLSNRSERGFILAVVLVFLLVLSVSAYFAAAMTRTDIQVVNNIQNEKKALAIAEAGVDEALYRMSIVGTGAAGASGANPVTIAGTSVNPSLAPQLPDTLVPNNARTTANGASPYGIDGSDTTSTAQILLTTTAPSAGTNNTTPTLQPVASRLSYSGTAGETAPVSLDATANLTMGWELCAANSTLTGCDPTNGAIHIRKLPVSNPRPVVKIVSSGTSGNATQKITVRATDADITVACPNCPGSLVGLGNGCGQGISMNGTTDLTAVGTVQLNAGAANTTPPPCPVAATGGAQSIVSANAINMSGVPASGANLSPAPTTGAPPMADPLGALLPPCFGSITTGCQNVGTLPVMNFANNAANGTSLPSSCTGTPTAPVTCSIGSATLKPGVYYGGLTISGTVTMTAGVYVMAGGGIVMNTGNSSQSTDASGGVMIYNTQDDNPTGRSVTAGQYGQFVLGTGNATVSLVAPTSGYYAGISYFQDRNNTLTVDLRGGNSGNYTLDGVIYASSAGVDLQGHTNQIIGGSLIAAGPFSLSGGSNITVGNPSTPCAQCTAVAGTRYVALSWQDF